MDHPENQPLPSLRSSKPAKRVCAYCRTRNRAAAKFCDNCGKSLNPGIIRTPLIPTEDELKYVTVLFADIVNSTALVAEVSPDEAQLLLAPAVRLMLDAVCEFGGTINRIVGDGVLAFFGFPSSQEDHALRACCAALRMNDLAAQLDVPASLRVGLASGFALLSTEDERSPGKHTAFGVTVHLAARLQSMTRPGTILCSAETKTLAGSAVEMASFGRRAIRGLPIEQDLFEVVRLRPTNQRFGPAAADAPSPYIGRIGELEQLGRCAEAARVGGAQIVAVLGEAGAGKSRLAWEFAGSLSARGWQIVRAEAASYGREIPHRLVATLLRSCVGIEECDSPTEYAAKQAARLIDKLGNEPILASAVRLMLDLPLGESRAQWDALEPLARREALGESIRRIIHSVAADAPTLVLVEDLHWSDEESLRVLSTLARASSPILLLATYRTGFAPTWGDISPTVISLAPLSQNEMARMLERAFPDVANNQSRQELLERAAGNPFFLEELARSARASVRAAGGEEAGGAAKVPATIEAVLAERIDRLEIDDKRVLRAASALGNRFSQFVLQKIFADRPAAAFQSQLSRLRQAGLLRRDKSADGEDGFAHALIQEVTYHGLPRRSRRDLHARIMRTIANISAELITDQTEMLAFHALRGEVWEATAVYARCAGQRAAGRSAYHAAAAYFEQALGAYEYLPKRDQTLAEQIDVCFELRNSLFPTSSIGGSLAYSHRAEKLALQLGDRERLGLATAYHARDLSLLGRQSEALPVARRALEVADNDDLRIIIQSYVALAAYYQGNYTQSAADLYSLVETVERRDRMRRLGFPAPAAVFFRGWLTWALARLGRSDEAKIVTDAMSILADESGQPLCATFTHLARGFALSFAGRLQEAREELQAGVDLCRKWEFFSWFTNIASCLGHVLSRLGECDAGIDLLNEAIARTKASGILVSHANELAWLAEAFDRAGNHATAAHQAEAAIAVAIAHEERGNEALARVVLAETLMKTGRSEESRAQFRLSLDLAAKCRMVPLMQRGRIGLSMLEQSQRLSA